MTAAGIDCLEALASLLRYPYEPLDGRVSRCVAALDPADDAAAALGRFEQRLAGIPLSDLQEHYTATFDFSPACALDVGWHVFGDSRERGGFLVQLREDLQRVGVPERSELPDHLSTVLALIAREQPDRAARLAAFLSPVVSSVRGALNARGSVYADLLAAIDSLVASRGARLCERPDVATGSAGTPHVTESTP